MNFKYIQSTCLHAFVYTDIYISTEGAGYVQRVSENVATATYTLKVTSVFGTES